MIFCRYYLIKTLPKNEIPKNQKAKNLQNLQWTSNHKNIVLEFINEPKSPNVIPYSDFSKPFVVNFDVSEKGLGAVLYQKLDGMKKL